MDASSSESTVEPSAIADDVTIPGRVVDKDLAIVMVWAGGAWLPAAMPFHWLWQNAERLPLSAYLLTFVIGFVFLGFSTLGALAFMWTMYREIRFVRDGSSLIVETSVLELRTSTVRISLLGMETVEVVHQSRSAVVRCCGEVPFVDVGGQLSILQATEVARLVEVWRARAAARTSNNGVRAVL